MCDDGTRWIHAVNAPRLSRGETIRCHLDGVVRTALVCEVDRPALRVRVRPLDAAASPAVDRPHHDTETCAP